MHVQWTEKNTFRNEFFLWKLHTVINWPSTTTIRNLIKSFCSDPYRPYYENTTTGRPMNWKSIPGQGHVGQNMKVITRLSVLFRLHISRGYNSSIYNVLNTSIPKFSTLPTECIYVFRMVLTINSDSINRLGLQRRRNMSPLRYGLSFIAET
jgi:hypothetical protein